MAIEQFLYFHGRAPGAPSSGFDFQCTSPGITPELRRELRPFCFFRKVSDQNRACLSRRVLPDDRCVVTYKIDLQDDNRYIVHGIVAEAWQVSSFEAAGLAFSPFWIDTETRLPDAGTPLASLELGDLQADDQVVWLADDTRQNLGELLNKGQLDLGDDFVPAATALQSVVTCLLPSARTTSEFVIGEQPKSFGEGRIQGFARIILAPGAAGQQEGHADWGHVVTLLKRDPELWTKAIHDHRVTYTMLATLGQLHDEQPAPDTTLSLIGSLTAEQRMAALGEPHVAEALISALERGTSASVRSWRQLLAPALVVEDPIMVDLGAERARQALLAGALRLSDGPGQDRAVLAALAWLALRDLDSSSPQPPKVGGWLGRLFAEAGGSPNLERVPIDEAMPSMALGLLQQIGWPMRLPTDEVASSIIRFGVPDDDDLILRWFADDTTGRRVVARICEEPYGLTSLAAELLSRQGSLTLFASMMKANHLLPDVVRRVLQMRPDYSWEQLAAGQPRAVDAIWPVVSDLPAARELLEQALGQEPPPKREFPKPKRFGRGST